MGTRARPPYSPQHETSHAAQASTEAPSRALSMDPPDAVRLAPHSDFRSLILSRVSAGAFGTIAPTSGSSWLTVPREVDTQTPELGRQREHP